MNKFATLPIEWVLAAFTLTWGAILWRRRRATAARWWAASFFLLGLAAIAGEVTDGWIGEDRNTDYAWDAMLVLFGLVAYCAVAATIASTIRHGRRERFYALGAIAFAGYLALIGTNPVFGSAIVAYAVGMLLVLVQQSVAWLDGRVSSAPWIAAGTAVNIIAVIVQLRVSGFHSPQASPDLFYLLLIPGGWLLYRGGRRLSNAES
jgi:hypothetical protein